MEYEDPLSHISFSDPRWLSSGFAITSQNVMEYFALSGFYDRTCNNEVCKMQGLTAPDNLKNMTGVEYVLLESQEPYLYIIRKQQRDSPTSVIPLALYYCLNGIVYQSPSVLSVACSRILNSLYYIQTAMKEVKERAVYAPTSGYAWDMESTAAGIASKNDPLRKVQTNKDLERQAEQDTIINRSLRAVAQKFPVIASSASANLRPNLSLESPPPTPLPKGPTATASASSSVAASANAPPAPSSAATNTTVATLVPRTAKAAPPVSTITAPPPPLPTTITSAPPPMQLQLPDAVNSPTPAPLIPASTTTGVLTATKKKRKDAEEPPAPVAGAASDDKRRKKKGGK